MKRFQILHNIFTHTCLTTTVEPQNLCRAEIPNIFAPRIGR